MGRALAWSIILLAIIVIAFFVIPWATRLGLKSRTKLDRHIEHDDDLDSPDGPYNRPTV